MSKIKVILMRIFSILVSLIFVFSFAFSLEISEYVVTFKIEKDLSVNEEIKVSFKEPLNKTELNYIILGEFTELKIFSGGKEIDFSVSQQDDIYNINFSIPKGSREVFIKFKPTTLITSYGNIKEFFTTLKPPTKAEKAEIIVWLPQGYSIYNTISPRDGQKLTDGQKIYIRWSIETNRETPILVKFYRDYPGNEFFIVLIIALILAILAITVFFKKKTRIHFFKGFNESEGKVISILMERKVIYQNRIEKELKFSRAKMTRIMKKLQEKGLVEREKSGRTNRIRWKGLK